MMQRRVPSGFRRKSGASHVGSRVARLGRSGATVSRLARAICGFCGRNALRA